MHISRPPSTELGLRRDTVVLAEYSPLWRKAFREERAILANALASVPCEIEHIGSTAVPGLEAKPILDIAVGVEDPYPIEDCIPAIEETGYIYRGEVIDAGTAPEQRVHVISHLLVRGPEDQVRTHHLHVVRLGGPSWRHWLTFRDYLRGDADARKTYATEKTKLAILYKEDRGAYTEAKGHVIGTLLARTQSARAQ